MYKYLLVEILQLEDNEEPLRRIFPSRSLRGISIVLETTTTNLVALPPFAIGERLSEKTTSSCMSVSIVILQCITRP